MSLSPKHWLIVPAAGSGKRFGGEIPKQYQMLAGKAVASRTLDTLLQLPEIEQVLVGISPEDQWFGQLPEASRVQTYAGGKERADTVLNGLQQLAEASDDDWVLVHDIARPCVHPGDIRKLMQQLAGHETGGLLAAPVTDTIKRVASNQVQCTEDRSTLWAALTPQMFRLGKLRQALQQATGPITDEASAIEQMGWPHRVIEGRRDNIKITRQEDLLMAAAILESIK